MVVTDGSGAAITRDDLRANTLRDWRVIPRTIAIAVTIDSVELESETSATVHTSQRWSVRCCSATA